MSSGNWALSEANRIRAEMLREREPSWSETLEETERYLELLGKSPIAYVEAWLAFRPALEALRRGPASPTTTAVAQSTAQRLQSRELDRGLGSGAGSPGGRWFVG